MTAHEQQAPPDEANRCRHQGHLRPVVGPFHRRFLFLLRQPASAGLRREIRPFTDPGRSHRRHDADTGLHRPARRRLFRRPLSFALLHPGRTDPVHRLHGPCRLGLLVLGSLAVHRPGIDRFLHVPPLGDRNGIRLRRASLRPLDVDRQHRGDYRLRPRAALHRLYRGTLGSRSLALDGASGTGRDGRSSSKSFPSRRGKGSRAKGSFMRSARPSGRYGGRSSCSGWSWSCALS